MRDALPIARRGKAVGKIAAGQARPVDAALPLARQQRQIGAPGGPRTADDAGRYIFDYRVKGHRTLQKIRLRVNGGVDEASWRQAGLRTLRRPQGHFSPSRSKCSISVKRFTYACKCGLASILRARCALLSVGYPSGLECDGSSEQGGIRVFDEPYRHLRHHVRQAPLRAEAVLEVGAAQAFSYSASDAAGYHHRV